MKPSVPHCIIHYNLNNPVLLGTSFLSPPSSPVLAILLMFPRCFCISPCPTVHITFLHNSSLNSVICCCCCCTVYSSSTLMHFIGSVLWFGVADFVCFTISACSVFQMSSNIHFTLTFSLPVRHTAPLFSLQSWCLCVYFYLGYWCVSISESDYSLPLHFDLHVCW
jgi:hypothetical protein